MEFPNALRWRFRRTQSAPEEEKVETTGLLSAGHHLRPASCLQIARQATALGPLPMAEEDYAGARVVELMHRL